MSHDDIINRMNSPEDIAQQFADAEVAAPDRVCEEAFETYLRFLKQEIEDLEWKNTFGEDPACGDARAHFQIAHALALEAVVDLVWARAKETIGERLTRAGKEAVKHVGT